jgi:hypothetical protein
MPSESPHNCFTMQEFIRLKTPRICGDDESHCCRGGLVNLPLEHDEGLVLVGNSSVNVTYLIRTVMMRFLKWVICVAA